MNFTADLSDFRQLVMPFVPKCPIPVANLAIIRAARKLCTAAAVSVMELSFTTTAGEPEIPLDTAEPRVEIANIETVTVDDAPLEKARVGEYEADGTWRSILDTPAKYTRLSQGALTLIPVPATTGQAVKVMVRVCPAKSANGLDVDLLRYDEVIAAGALAYLLKIPGPWFSIGLAEAKKQEFLDGVALAMDEASGSFVGAPIRVTPCA